VFGLHLPRISWGGPVALTASVQNKAITLALLNNPFAFGSGHKVNLPSMLLLAGSPPTLSTVWEHPSIGIDHVS
jgi:hypothetical protein